VPCGTSRVVPGAHRVVGPGTHRGSGPREAHTTPSHTQAQVSATRPVAEGKKVRKKKVERPTRGSHTSARERKRKRVPVGWAAWFSGLLGLLGRRVSFRGDSARARS
jgi:hypothetical protein